MQNRRTIYQLLARGFHLLFLKPSLHKPFGSRNASDDSNICLVGPLENLFIRADRSCCCAGSFIQDTTSVIISEAIIKDVHASKLFSIVRKQDRLTVIYH